ncbi:MAG: helix-hairpin-helix domain-containing protein [Vicinamibacteria bacterium]|nr:helix-hairpin-helix domain-containing protein [Vicinamibacteria bacterium]
MSPLSFDAWFPTECPGIDPSGARAVIRLAEDGATVPFIARYRKEQTRNLDEVSIQKVLDAKERWDATLARQAFIMEQIERQRALTPELKEAILSTFDAAALEDLYLPFKRKRQSRAALAREAGIGPLADWIWNCGHGADKPLPGQTLDIWAYTFRSEGTEFADLDSVLQGARDILTERISEFRELRQKVRDAYFKKAFLVSERGEQARPHSKFERYFEHREAVTALLKPQNAHRYQALRRGASEGELKLTLAGNPQDVEFESSLLAAFETAACTVPDSPGADLLKQAARQAFANHVAPSIVNEVHRALKKVADEAAIRVFAENVRQLLLASPFGPKVVIGVDPGLRSGSKAVLVDENGRYLKSAVLRTDGETETLKAKADLADLLDDGRTQAIAVGNGTGGREAETFVRRAVKELERKVPVVMVSESGASVYSASAVAREEFPNLDVTIRGAISIARRMQDPLAELVKIDPRSIGVGQYQHDVTPLALKKSLDFVVDSCVNLVGVNLNTASHHLLTHVSGLGPALARAVVEHRSRHGLFRSRRQLLDVPRFTRKTFEQAAGFLRVPESDHPLDNTGVHPERYAAIEALALRMGKPLADLLGPGAELLRAAGELRDEIGAFTFEDIVREIEKPGRDPREAFVPFEFRDDVRRVEDLKPGMVCPGIVTNVTSFGAFVDIGVHHDGLVHISQLAERFVRDPREIAKPGDRVQVRILSVDLEKHQIFLSMRDVTPKRMRAERSRPARQQRPAIAPRRDAVTKRPAPPDKRPGRPASSPGGKKGKPAPVHGKTNSGERPRPAPRPAFNNPFAVLAKLKPQKPRPRA